jgi:serine/threonine protein kinase
MPRPTTVGKYHLIHEIGKGSMGRVYHGRDSLIQREVAVKIAHLERLACPRTGDHYERLFFREARTAGLLMHQDIAAVFDAGIDQGLPYIVLEYVAGGRTLADFCTPDRLLPVAEAIKVFHKCASALDYAHGRGVVHRDIKPNNILIGPNQEVKITDFGIAVLSDFEDDEVLGETGSPLYMSPEQIRREPLTGQSDLFSLGSVMYRALTGKHPFAAAHIATLNDMVLHDDPPSMRELRPELPEILERIARKAMAKDRRRRYRSGLDLAADLSLVFDYLTPKPH